MPREVTICRRLLKYGKRASGVPSRQLQADADVLGLKGRTDIVKAALQMLHRRAAEERMGRGVDAFYRGGTPALPIGVLPYQSDATEPKTTNTAKLRGPA
jgi:hypothetical protein